MRFGLLFANLKSVLDSDTVATWFYWRMAEGISLVPGWLALAYLGIHAGLLLVDQRPTRWIALAVDLALAGAFLLLLWLHSLPSQHIKGWTLISLWAPLVFFWWAYRWAGHTLQAVHPAGRTWDEALIRLEQRWLGQPSLNWASVERPLLSELLHFFYFSYYLYTPLLAIFLHLSGRWTEFEAVSFAICFGYLVAYTCFSLTPALGPRWALVERGLLKPQQQRLPGYLFVRLIDKIMYGGVAHRGGAFPSAHSSTAVVFLIWAYRLWGMGAGCIAFGFVVGMWVGSVYGRYHYVTDVVLGAFLGLLGVVLADWIILGSL